MPVLNAVLTDRTNLGKIDTFLSKLFKGHLIAVFQLRPIKHSPFYSPFSGFYNFAIKIHSTLKLAIHGFIPEDIFKDTKAEISLFWWWFKWILTFNPAAQHIGKLKNLLKITAKKKSFCSNIAWIIHWNLDLLNVIWYILRVAAQFQRELLRCRYLCTVLLAGAGATCSFLERPIRHEGRAFIDREDAQAQAVLKAVWNNNFSKWALALRGGKSCITRMPIFFPRLAMGTVALSLSALENYRKKLSNC